MGNEIYFFWNRWHFLGELPIRHLDFFNTQYFFTPSSPFSEMLPIKEDCQEICLPVFSCSCHLYQITDHTKPTSYRSEMLNSNKGPSRGVESHRIIMSTLVSFAAAMNPVYSHNPVETARPSCFPKGTGSPPLCNRLRQSRYHQESGTTPVMVSQSFHSLLPREES